MVQSIVIIGAAGKIGSIFAKALAKTRYRLLLFDDDSSRLNALARAIRSMGSTAEIEVMHCASDASWEADIIIPDISFGEEEEVAAKIEPFTNRKIILATRGNYDSAALEKLLPGAVFVNAFSASGKITESARDLIIESDNAEALDTSAEVLGAAGFIPIIKHTDENNIIQSKNNTMETQSKNNTMETTKWIIDPTHSELHFKIRHLMVSWVTGSFKKFDATIQTQGDDLSTANIRLIVDIDSISTNNEQRDAHLRTGDFFDAENYPQVIFQSEKLEKIDAENYKLYGTLSMRGTSKKITLNVEHGGITTDPWGNTRTGFSVSGKINRKEFGVSFSMVSETGGVLLGEEVTINANVEFIKEVAVQTKAA